MIMVLGSEWPPNKFCKGFWAGDGNFSSNLFIEGCSREESYCHLIYLFSYRTWCFFREIEIEMK